MKGQIIIAPGTDKEERVPYEKLVFHPDGSCTVVLSDNGARYISSDVKVEIAEITKDPVETNKPEYDWGTWDVEKHVNDTNKLREADTANPGGGN